MSTKPIIIDTWNYTEGYVGCIMGNEPHSVLDEVAVTVHMRPGRTAGRRLRPGRHVHRVCDREAWTRSRTSNAASWPYAGIWTRAGATSSTEPRTAIRAMRCECHPDGSEMVYS